MRKVQKTVRFYDTVIVSVSGERHSVQPEFWTTVLDRFQDWPLWARSGMVQEVDYMGSSVLPLRPAIRYLRVERIRDLSEQLNRANISSGEVEPLDFDDPDDRVSEPTFVVPFGSAGRVAILSPAILGTRPETIAKWLTLVLDLVTSGYTLELVPVVDADVLQRIIDADGALMLEVRVDPGESIPGEGGGIVGNAFRAAQEGDLEDLGLVLKWSLRQSNGSQPIRDALRNAALWVAQAGFSASAKVKLAGTRDDGRIVRDEVRDIFKDRLTKKVTFNAQRGSRISDEEVLTAIDTAIREFQSPTFGVPGTVAGTTSSVSTETFPRLVTVASDGR